MRAIYIGKVDRNKSGMPPKLRKYAQEYCKRPVITLASNSEGLNGKKYTFGLVEHCGTESNNLLEVADPIWRLARQLFEVEIARFVPSTQNRQFFCISDLTVVSFPHNFHTQ